MLAVCIDALQVVRGRHKVLTDVTFDIPARGVVGLLGPSGSGKTTLLRCILGVQKITAGTVTVLGQPAGASPLRSRIGYASQAASVYDDLTVSENIRYFAAMLDLERAEVNRVIDAVDMTSKATELTGQLSGGQRSRVSLAVAMLGRPKLLVLDEPTVGLDPVLREDLWSLFHRLAAEGATLLVSSHVMEEAERCDSLLLLRDGSVLAHDSPATLKQRTGAVSMDEAFLRLVKAE